MSSNEPEASDYPGRGDLPDALAFVTPSRARFWIRLNQRDDPVAVSELKETSNWSRATIYRMLDELDEVGLTEAVRTLTPNGPETAYQAVEPDESEVPTRR